MKEKDIEAVIKKITELGRTLEFVTPTDRFLIAPADEYVASYHWVYQYQEPPVHPYNGEECTGMLLFIPKELDDEVRSVCPDLAWFRFHESGVDLSGEPHEKGEAIQSILDYLGLKKEENASSDNDLTSKLMQIIIDMRQNAKSNKDWATSDKIRDELKAAGVQLKDTKEGVVWEVE